MLGFALGEVVAAIACGYATFAIGVHRLGWQEDNALPLALFAGLAGAFVVDRWAKRVIGGSLLRALVDVIPDWP